jgi:hypothetical protein
MRPPSNENAKVAGKACEYGIDLQPVAETPEFAGFRGRLSFLSAGCTCTQLYQSYIVVVPNMTSGPLLAPPRLAG